MRHDELPVVRERLAIAVEGDAVPVLFDDDGDLDATIDLGMKLIDTYLDRVEVPDRVIGVEIPFSMHLVDADSQDVLNIPLVGALDALVEVGGRTEVWELKTAKRKWSADQIQYDLPAPRAGRRWDGGR